MIELTCPQCSRSFDAHTAMGDRLAVLRPVPGDMSICLYCSAILVFSGQPLEVRLAGAADLAELPEEVLDDLYLARAVLQTYRHSHTP